MPRWIGPLATTCLFFVLPSARAQEAEDKSAEFTVETIVRNLDAPWGLAIRVGRDKAGPHELFIAESGAGRVIRVTTDQPGQVHEALTGFHVSKSATLPEIGTSPLAVAFLTRTKLIVAGKAAPAGPQQVRVYVLPGDDAVQTADKFDHELEQTRAGDASGDLWAIATTATAAYVTATYSNGDGAILKAHHEANRLEALRPFVSAKKGGDIIAPAAISLTPVNRPQFLVVGDRGSPGTAGDSRLLFYTLESGKLALGLDTGLNDIMGLAYGPTGQLYAVDAAWNEAGQGGVYRLDDARHEGRQSCRAVKIASVTRGISLAFAPDGALYVTSLGKNPKQGSLVKITGNF